MVRQWAAARLSPFPDAVSGSQVGQVEALSSARLPEVRPLLADPAVSCFAEARLFPTSQTSDWGRPQVLAFSRTGRTESAVLLGANLVPIATTRPAREALAEVLIRQGRRCSSILGPASQVLPLWELLAPYWGAAREVREDQPLLVLSGPPLVTPDDQVRPVPLHRLQPYLPASVAMFTEEVGVDPRLGGLHELYRARVGELLRSRRAFARWDNDRVVFKAELGAVTPRAVQVQGVWVDPEFRGRGYAAPGMAAVADYGFSLAPLVTLYVNSYNLAALATYRRVGFRQVGTFATVLF